MLPLHPSVQKLLGGLSLTNQRGFVVLRNKHRQTVDALLYGDTPLHIDGWTGPPVQLYARGAIGASGQVWHRKRHPLTDQPLDSDRALDWSSDLSDMDWGRRAFYPGWETEKRVRPVQGTESAWVTTLIAPEGLYEPMRNILAGASHSIDLSLYVLEHPELSQTIARAAQRGVRVRLMLEGSPVGGITDMQRWCVAQIAEAGGEVRYMAAMESAPRGYQPRYRYSHAKYGIIDGVKSFVGSENLTWDSAPVTATNSGGRRGYYLFTDAHIAAEGLSQIFEADWQPHAFLDLRPFEADHAIFGAPPEDFALAATPRISGGVGSLRRRRNLHRRRPYHCVERPRERAASR